MSMKYIWKYKTPEGFDDLVMSGDGEALTGLWFACSRDAVRRGEAVELRETPVFRETCRWLDEYFAGRAPGFHGGERLVVALAVLVDRGNIEEARRRKSLGACGRRCGWVEPDWNNNSVPPRDRRGQRTYGLRRRPWQQGIVACP